MEITSEFKVGDKVITSYGEVGVIKSICDCDKCKQRGFLEPQVETEIGVGRIWITDTDKENGFKSFYQIGDYVFGNTDEEFILTSIDYARERFENEVRNISELQKQLGLIRLIKDDE